MELPAGFLDSVARARSEIQVAEITDKMLEVSRPGHRGLILQELREVLNLSKQGPEDDPRFLKIRLDAIARMERLLKVHLADEPKEREGDLDRRALVAKALRDLGELEARS